MQSFEVKIRVEGIEERLEFTLKFTEDTPDQSIILALRSKVKAERRDTITLESLSGALIPISTKSIMPEKECRLIVERRKKRGKCLENQIENYFNTYLSCVLSHLQQKIQRQVSFRSDSNNFPN